jgi:hypothetical protein
VVFFLVLSSILSFISQNIAHFFILAKSARHARIGALWLNNYNWWSGTVQSKSFFFLFYLCIFYRSFLKTSLISLDSRKYVSCANRGTLAK